MRIAIVSWNRRRHGGAEEHIAQIVSPLLNSGHEVAFWHSVDEPSSFSQIPLPRDLPIWSASEWGEQRAIAAMRDWRPDVIYAQGLDNPNTEAEILKVAPAVFCAHNYYGTCITGSKMTNFPRAEPCGRRFGAKCLVNFYPRRCGGLSPVTMWREYRRQTERLNLLSRYGAIVTISRHMANEYINNGFDPSRVHYLPSPVGRSDHTETGFSGNGHVDLNENQYSDDSEVRLTFLGRMHYSKGSSTLYAALPLVADKLKRAIHLTFAGDGPERAKLERLARRSKGTAMDVEFAGWVSQEKRDELLRKTHLLVVPSLWPEPFGMVGLEACTHGVPVVAFDSGGIREWLREGVNGYLAPSSPPTARGLADAIVRVFSDPSTHSQLRQGAARVARSLDQQAHVHKLLEVFLKVAKPPH